MERLRKALAALAMCAALTLGAIADTWADVPEGIDAGTGQLAVACAMDDGIHGAFKATKVHVAPKAAPARSYGAPSGMTEAQAKEWIAQRESGGDYDAVSPSGKYVGRYQLSRDKLNGDYSAANQEAVADAYVKNRYGSWAKAQEHWQRFGWY